MKKLLPLLALFLLGCGTQPETAESVIARIKAPVFSNNIFDVTELGAIGDSVTDCKPAFDAAIAACKQDGSGSVVVPAGIYLLNGPIHLVSNMNLHLEEGSRLKFSSNPAHYLPVVKTSWEGTFLYSYSPFIYGYQLENVAITGSGVIDGEGSKTFSPWYPLQDADQQLSREMNHKNVPVEERVFGEGHYLRPHLVQLYGCNNILIEGVRLEDSPFWCVHLLECRNATVRGISFSAYNRNNDGIDPEYSEDVLIENVVFNNADDNVAIKAGRDHEGRAAKHGGRNIVVRNCQFRGLHALVIGSEMSAGVENVFVQNCGYAGKLKRGIYLKSNPDRGGYIRNIFVDNVQLGQVEDGVFITSYYHGEGKGYATDIHNVRISNLSIEKATNAGVVVQGFPEKKVRDIYFTNVSIGSAPNAIDLTNTENIVMENVRIGAAAGVPSAAN